MVANEKTEKRKRKSATCDERNLVRYAIMFRKGFEGGRVAVIRFLLVVG
jgi:hypothetical protein